MRATPGPAPSPTGELLALPQLDAHELEGLARLEAACRDSDGGRLKLEWPTLRARSHGATSDFIWLSDGTIVGFAGLYQWRPVALEVTGMVHPAYRRQGIGSTLYDAAAAEIAARAPAMALLVVDRRLEDSERFVLDRGGELDHSEHRMSQLREPDARDDGPPVRLRPAVLGDAEFVAECLAAGFEEEQARFDPVDQLARAAQIASVTVIETVEAGNPVGVMKVEEDGSTASIFGFAVMPEERGKGYGRSGLLAATRRLRRAGIETISLEVLTNNDRALHLYTTCGFELLGTEDYYSLPIAR